jgi:hypothetical protein
MKVKVRIGGVMGSGNERVTEGLLNSKNRNQCHLLVS